MARCAVAALFALLFLPVPGWAAAPKNVLIVRGESPDLPGVTVLVDAVESSLRKNTTAPVDFYIELVDTGHFDVGTYEERLAALLADKYADIPLDLVVTLSEPAAQFVLRERANLFPRTPLLLGLVDAHMIGASDLPPAASVVYVAIDAPGTIRFAQQTYPEARRVLVASGTSRYDRGWERIVRDQLREMEPSLPIAYDSDSSIEDLARRVSQLPPDTIVLYLSMTRDGADRPEQPVTALETLRASASVPIFGMTSILIGHGIVGGSVLDFARHGRDLGAQALRMLAGETPVPITSPAALTADWREMQRFHIPASRVPAETAVFLREPTLWEQEQGTIVAAAVIVLAQAGLILALVRTISRRRTSEADLLGRLRFERMLSEFSVSLTAMTPTAFAEAVEPALARFAAPHADWVWRWWLDDPLDAGWDSPPLRAGQSVTFALAEEMPPSVQHRLQRTGAQACSAFAVPLVTGGVTTGAIFWARGRGGVSWAAHADQLRVVASVTATMLERKEAVLELESSHHLKGAILDSLPAHIAVLDRQGVVIAVNDAWSRFAQTNDVRDISTVAPGISYLDSCRAAIQAGNTTALEAVTLIELACRGEHPPTRVEYRCDSPAEERWFMMSAEPLRRADGGAVITHWDITARKRNEIALLESEDRFRRMADALPIGVWMSDAAGGCIYTNNYWLEMTGRTLEQQTGEGWLDSVHVADRSGFMDVFLRAFQVREGFRIEYRLRRHDGQYRWFIDTGVPRYGSDGAFHGYVGGCVDITARKEAEDLLRGLSHRLMAAQDGERRRIARELHDHLSQQLALLAIDLQQLSVQPPATIDAFVPILQEAWRRTTEIASDVHAISHRLHPSKMEALGLVATIRAHCREVSRQSLAVQFHEQNVPPNLSPERALSLFRVVEEALSNVIRHSGAHSAQVALGGVDGDLLLRIADDGRGFAVEEQGSGLGLISMRERVESLSGSLSITSTPGRGTVVEARVPALGAPDPFTVIGRGARAESA